MATKNTIQKTQKNHHLRFSQNFHTCHKQILSKKNLLALLICAVVSLVLTTTSAYATSAYTADAYATSATNANTSMEQNTDQTFNNKYNQTELKKIDKNAHNYTDGQATTSTNITNANLPASFDMRDKGWISKVRNQSPWGTCWSFAITAASESSIQHDLVETGNKANDIDMSEHHLAWFAKSHLPEKGQATNNATAQETNKAASDNLATGSKYNNQEGEGTYTKDDLGSARMSSGVSFLGTPAYASGMGIVSESFCPYKGANGWVIGSDRKTYASYDECVKAGATPICYSSEDDWSLSEDIRFVHNLQLQESNLLPNIMIENGSGYTLDKSALKAAKDQIQKGHALAVGYKADDTTFPNTGRYMNVVEDASGNKTFSQYTWEKKGGDHLVCIVGWDDNYDASNFTINNPVKWDMYGNKKYKLTGVELKNDWENEGKPYYESMSGEKIYVDTTNTGWVIKTEKTDEKGYSIYKLTNNELNNNMSGYPLIPGTDEPMPGFPSKDNVFTYARENDSHTPPGNGAWIVKNSWGANSQDFPNHGTWGNNAEGYFYLSYYDLSLTEIETYDFYVEQAGENPHNYSYCAQYDYMAGVEVNSLSSDNKACMANTYTATDTYKIKNISCNTSHPETTVNYKLYLLNENSQNPMDGTLVAEQSAKYDYGGYHRIDLTNPVVVKAGQKYSIVAEEYRNTTTNNANNKKWDYVFVYGPGPNYKQKEQQIYYKAVVNPGESSLGLSSSDGQITWHDWGDYIKTSDAMKEYRDRDTAVDNFSLKAYADPVDDPHDDPTDPPGGGDSGSASNDSGNDSSTSAATGDNLNLNLLLAALIVSGVCCSISLRKCKCRPSK